ncbi:MAG TPA: XdhC family protein [Nitrososphaerales archaeon]|nr:XdhC family protein [Nitrososphaerales archaeon]
MTQIEFARITGDLVNKREPFAVATVVKIEGASLGKPGFKEVISKEGEILYGSLGGVCPDSAIVELAKKTLASGLPRIVKVYLQSVEDAVEGVVKSQNEDEIHVETNCGGTMEIYIEPYTAQRRLVIIGQGGKDDVEDALVKLGKITDFEVVVIDHSPVLSQAPDHLVRDANFDLSRFKFYETDAVVVLTRGARDVETLQILSRSRPGYVGMMGSRQRAKDNFEALLKAGVAEEFIASIRAPIGIEMGALTSGEIAISIMAEIIAGRHGKELPHRRAGDEAKLLPAQ